MKEKNQIKRSSLDRSISDESISLLEWDTLKVHLSSFASTKMGKEAILAFELPSIFEKTRVLLDETKEINDLESQLEKNISFNGVYDIAKNMEICFKGGVISAKELLEIAETISSARKLKKTILNFGIRPVLSALLNKLVDHNQLEKIIKNGIETSGRISNNASDKLKNLRHEIL